MNPDTAAVFGVKEFFPVDTPNQLFFSEEEFQRNCQIQQYLSIHCKEKADSFSSFEFERFNPNSLPPVLKYFYFNCFTEDQIDVEHPHLKTHGLELVKRKSPLVYKLLNAFIINADIEAIYPQDPIFKSMQKCQMIIEGCESNDRIEAIQHNCGVMSDQKTAFAYPEQRTKGRSLTSGVAHEEKPLPISLRKDPYKRITFVPAFDSEDKGELMQEHSPAKESLLVIFFKTRSLRLSYECCWFIKFRESLFS